MSIRRIGVISDTHGNLEMMRSAVVMLTSAHGVERLIHLGDYYRDGEVLRREGLPVWIAPGLSCPQYAGPERIVKAVLEGLQLVCAHTPEDLEAHAGKADLALHGHTHVPRAERRGGAIWFNPGHLKARMDRGQPACYGLLEIEPALVRATVYELAGPVRMAETYPRPLAGNPA